MTTDRAEPPPSPDCYHIGNGQRNTAGLPLCTAAATYRSGRWVLVTSRPMRRGASRNAIARLPEFLLRQGFW